MSNFILFGLISLGSIGLIGMLAGFQLENLWIWIVAFGIGMLGYAIWLFADSEEITLTNEATE